MLDTTVKLFNVSLPTKEVKNTALVMAGCNAYIRDMIDKDSIVYSEMEEMSFSYLNSNDYETFSMEIELCFENNLFKPYHCFFAGCFSIKTDNDLRIKLDGHPKEKYYSKVNKNNQMVIGIGLYFRSQKEYEIMLESKVILIEGFIALDSYDNTFQVSCKLKKQDVNWDILFANTYQMQKKDDIRGRKH